MSCPPAPDGSDVSTCTFNWGNNLMHQGNNKKAITPCQWSTVFNHIRDGNPNYFSWADNCTIIDQDLIIASNSNILWDRPKYLNRDVVVENGATLTITCTVRMATGTKIIVKRGGHLIVDGGTITSLCDDYWQGIEVWGNPNLAQSTQNQGLLTLKNEATLEYAHNAVSLAQNSFGTTGGGIIKAVNANFINNKRSVEFIKYTKNNKSSFNNCTFELNADYGLNGFLQHVSMWSVRGVSFSNCDFLNNSTIGNVSNRGDGILSLDAQYLVQLSDFDGFLYGIRATNAQTVNTFTARTSNFIDNSVGVYAGAVSNIEVLNNIFEVGLRPFFKDSSSDLLNHGVFVEGGTGYHVEDNDFFGAGGFNADAVGVLIKNTGGESNMVYRNDFFGLDYANLSNGDNRNNNNSFLGLEYICNENTGNLLFDFAVPREFSEGSINQFAGISENQGRSSESAGNTFSFDLNANATGFHFRNRSAWTIRYWYNPVAANQQPVDIQNVLDQTGGLNECSTIDRTNNPKDDYQAIKETYQNVRGYYDLRIDGGNTSELNSIIYGSL